MTDLPSDLKGCPWCRSRRLRRIGKCIECLSCGASGPEMKREDTRRDYIHRWNARAPASPPEPTTNPPEIGSKSVVEPTAEHWRRAMNEYAALSLTTRLVMGLCAIDWIEQRARELAQEGE